MGTNRLRRCRFRPRRSGRRNWPVTSPIPTRKPTARSRPACSTPPCIRARLRRAARATARRLKIKSSASRTSPATRYSSNPKAATRSRSIRTACPPVCRSTSSARWSTQSRGWSGPRSCGQAMPSSTTLPTRRRSRRPWRPKLSPVSISPDRSTARPATKRPRPRV